MKKIEQLNIDLMTGRVCVQMDQLPVGTSSESSRRLAIGLASGAFILAVVGIGVVAPRIGSNTTNPIEVPSTRIK